MSASNDSPTLKNLLEHESWLRGLARQLTNDPNDAEDLVQNTRLAALRTRAVKEPAAWLQSVMRNLARARWRDRARLTDERHLPRAGVERTSSSSLEEVTEHDVRRQLAKAVTELEEPMQSLLLDHFYEGLTLTEIARASGVPEGTVRWRKSKALELLRGNLDEKSRGDRTAWLGALALWIERPRRSLSAVGVGGFVVIATIAGLAIWMIAGANRPEVKTINDVQQVSLALGESSTPIANLTSEPVDAPQDLDAVDSGAQPEAAEGSAEVADVRVKEPLVLPISVKAADGTGIPGAEISVMGLGSQRLAGVTGPDGTASIEYEETELTGAGYVNAVGMLTVRASAEGFQTSSLYHYGQSVLDGTGVSARIKMRTGGASLNGQVLDSRQLPVQSARIFLRESGTLLQSEAAKDVMFTRGPVRATTDERGRFNATGLPGGKLSVVVLSEGCPPYITEVDLGGDDLMTMKLRLQEGSTAEGVVRDKEGRPVPFAQVWFDPPQMLPPPSYEMIPGYDPNLMWIGARAQADAAGRYRLPGIPVGPTRIWAAGPGDDAASSSNIGSRAVTDPRGDLSSIDIDLGAGRPIRLALSGGDETDLQGLAVRLTARGKLPRWERMLPLDSSGALHVVDCPEQVERLDLIVMPAGFRGRPIFRKLDFERPTETLRVKVQALREFRLFGTAFNSAGEPLVNASFMTMNQETQELGRSSVSHKGVLATTLSEGVYVSELAFPPFGIFPCGTLDLREADLVGFDIHPPGLGHLLPPPPGLPPAPGTRFELRVESLIYGAFGQQYSVASGQGVPTKALRVYPGKYTYEVLVEDQLLHQTVLDVTANSSQVLPAK